MTPDYPDFKAMAKSNARLRIAAAVIGGFGVALHLRGSEIFFGEMFTTDFGFSESATLAIFALLSMAVFVFSLHQFRVAIVELFDVAIPELLRIAFLVIWLGILWLTEQLSQFLVLSSNVDESVRPIFQLLFVITTVLPVVVFILQDIVSLFWRAWKGKLYDRRQHE